MEASTDELGAEAKRLISERRYDEAVRVSRRALLTAPDNVPLRLMLGEALLAQEKYDQTRVEMMALTRRHPEEAGAHRILGEAYLRSGQMEKAREALKQASVRGDAAAADLLTEAEGEAFVESSTIERWFGTDEPNTIETALPPIEEEDTPPPRRAPIAMEPSIQIDPAFAQEVSLAVRPDDLAGDTLPGNADMTQPMPRLPGFAVAPPESLRALLSKAKTSEAPPVVKRAAFVVPPPARVGEPLKPLASRASDALTSVAKPGVAAKPTPWQKSAPPPSSGTGSGIKRATLQGTPSPIPKTTLIGQKSEDPAKNAAAASAFGAGSRKKPTLMGAPSPLPIRAPLEDPSDLTTTNQRRLDLETTDNEHLVPEEEEEEDLTDIRSRSLPPSVLEAALGPPPPVAPAPAAPPPSARPTKATLVGVAAPMVAPRAAPPSIAPPPPARPPPSVPPPRPVAPPPPQAQRPSARPPARELHDLSDPAMSPMLATQPEIASPPSVRPSAMPRPAPPTPPRPAPPQPPPMQPPPMQMARPVPAGQTGALTRRMDEQPTDAMERPRRSPGDTTAGRRMPRGNIWGFASFAVVLLIGLAIGGVWFMHRQSALALAQDVERASDDGLRADIVDALARLEGDDSPEGIALRARLLATRAVEQGIGDTADAEMELGALDTAGGALLDARIARALVVLARGQADQAATLLSGVEGSGVTLAEALHVQALSLEALGQLSDARMAAVQAATLRPSGPRHAALVARLSLALGDVPAATAALAITNADASPLIRLVRGRIALAAGNAHAAESEAAAVLGPLLDATSPHDVAEAHVLRARAALLTGDRAAARAALDAAEPLRSPADETVALDIAEGYLDAGATEPATRVIASLPVHASSPQRRANIVVRGALAANDLAAADAALASLGPGSRTDLLRGQVRDAQGQSEEARMLYERAATDPVLAQDAHAREGELLVRMGRPVDARVVLDQVLRAAPTDARIAELFVRVALAAGDVSAAETALAPALAVHPESIPLRSAHARILLHRGHAPEAMAELQTVAAAAPADRALQESLAEAALACGNRTVAMTAYESALRIEPTASAHLGLAGVLADDARFDEAIAHVDGAEALGPSTAADVTRMRARIDVLRGLGASALGTIARATDASSRDAALWAYRAELEAQAETFSASDDSVTRALRLDASQPEALLVRALLAIEDGDLGGAARAVDRAERSATRRGLPPSFAARVAALRGRLRFEAGDEAGAERLGQEAIALDAHSGLAHLLLADVAIANHGDPVPELRAAASGTAAPPEAVGRLAMRLRTGVEACTFGREYIERAPTGYDRAEVDDVVRHCR